MEQLREYIEKVTGEDCNILKIRSKELGSVLPLYMTEMYAFYRITLFGKAIILMKLKDEDQLSIQQLSKHQSLIQEKLNSPAIVVLSELEGFQRSRMIDKRVQFIIPGKQLFMPYLFIDYNDRYSSRKREKRETLLPSAQLILLRYLLNKRNDFNIREHSFSELALNLGYSRMTITKAVDNLKSLELCEVDEQHKEKFIHFIENKHELWQMAEPYLVDPVLKIVYADSIPDGPYMPRSNYTAMSEYTELNPSGQKHYAVDKTVFYGLEKSDQLENLNPHEGEYCIEVWKYNPNKIIDVMFNDQYVVDPLSLYLHLNQNPDERTDYALEKLLDQLW